MPEKYTVADVMAAAPRSTNSNSPWGERYGAELRSVVRRYASRAPRTLQRHLGPSELGEACDRQVIGKMAAQKKTNNVTDPWPSIMGTAGHAWMEDAFQWENSQEGVRWLTEVRVTPDPGPDPHPGTADLYDAYTQSLVDWKFLGEASLSKLKAKGPKRVYYVQTLLYALGYINMGLPVQRVVLVAWPRTKSSMDEMYVWEHVPTDEDWQLVQRVLAETRIRQLKANEIIAGRAKLMDFPATPDDDSCHFCLAGNTEVVTRQGIKPIRELAGTTPELLVPTLSPAGWRKRSGSFQRHPVRYLGDQATYKITLGDRRARQEIVATAEHRWLITDRTRIQRDGQRKTRNQWQKTTLELQAGDLLQPLNRANSVPASLMRVAVAQGFAFGDGSNGQREQPGRIAIHADHKDEALLPFFDDVRAGAYPLRATITNLPRHWKELPPIRESRGFLLSWLAGYFAADGTVSDRGVCTLASASLENIRFVRDVAAVCGIETRPWKATLREGFPGRTPSYLYELPLRRRDLPAWFFLTAEHARRAEAANAKQDRESYWKVLTVEPTGLVEPVYCATVPGAEAFALAWSTSTMNCPFYRPQSAHDGGYGCPGTLLKKG
jgi:hypothetical protein